MMNRLLAETFGTFCLVFAGTGAIVVAQAGSAGLVAIALAFGLTVAAMIYAIGDISGCHINPALTVGFWLSGRFPAARVLPYVAAQIVGACLASLLLRLLFPATENLGVTSPSGAEWRSLVLEFFLTMILMFVVLRISCGAKEKGVTAGIAVGAVIALEILFAGPVSGASMNPARSLAPALVGMDFQHLWIYLVGPMLGAAAAVPLHRAVAGPESAWKPDACKE